MADDQGWGDTGYNGHPFLKTPHLDRMSKDGVTFNRFYSAAAMCSPTRGSVYTGRNPYRFGITFAMKGMLEPTEIPITTVLMKNGYTTGHFGKWHLGDNYPFRPQDRGFQEVLIHGAGGVGQTPDFFDNDYFNDTYTHNGKLEEYKGYCTDIWFEEAIKYIEIQKDNPFFCYISTNAPHGPFYVDNKYSEPYKGIKNVPSNEFYGMITNVDDNIGILTKKLEALGIADNTNLYLNH